MSVALIAIIDQVVPVPHSNMGIISGGKELSSSGRDACSWALSLRSTPPNIVISHRKTFSMAVEQYVSQ